MQADERLPSGAASATRMRNDLLLVVGVFSATQIGLVAAGAPFAGVMAVFTVLVLSTWRLHRQASSWAAVGLRRPVSWPGAIAAAVGWSAIAYLSAGIMQTFATRMLGWPPADLSRYGNLAGHFPRLVLLLSVAWTSAAFGEELLFRGLLLTRLAALLGNSRGANLSAVTIQAVLFGLAHAFQGPTGMLTASTIGLIFGVAYVRGRNLWPIIIGHGLIDTFGLVVFYFAPHGAA